MIPPARDFDVVHVGRACLDLYSNDIGAPFTEVTSFAAYVGGSPANVCVGARRLGLHVAMLTAVGDDPPGDFVVSFLQREGVDTGAIVRKPGFRTGLAMLSIEPPDHFSLIYYRDRPADWELGLDDVAKAPIARTRVLQIAGTNLAREPSRSATAAAAEAAATAGTVVVLDLDFRADQWEDPRRFGLAVRAILPLVDVVIGTEDEFKAIALQDRTAVRVVRSEVSEPFVPGDLTSAMRWSVPWALGCWCVSMVVAVRPCIGAAMAGRSRARTSPVTRCLSATRSAPVTPMRLVLSSDCYRDGTTSGWHGLPMPAAQ